MTYYVARVRSRSSSALANGVVSQVCDEGPATKDVSDAEAEAAQRIKDKTGE